MGEPLDSSPWALLQTPAHVLFLGRQSWMKDWPIQMLLCHPTQSFLEFFRNNQVIVADSSLTEYFYVVRSGQCVVLMKIDRVDCTWQDVSSLTPPYGTFIDDHLGNFFLFLFSSEFLRSSVCDRF